MVPPHAGRSRARARRLGPGGSARLNAFVADDHAQAFQIASTLRQFTQVWDVGAIDERGLGLVDILRARLLQVSGGELTLRPAALQRARDAAGARHGQLEAVLGEFGAKTFRWWKTGLERASAVCAIRSKVGDRVGTGWLVRAGSLQSHAGRRADGADQLPRRQRTRGQPRSAAGRRRARVRSPRRQSRLHGEAPSPGARRPSATTRACCA